MAHRTRWERLLEHRIVRWELKFFYVVGAWIAGYLIIALFEEMRLSALGNIIETMVTVAAILYGARVFRGRDEPVVPRRPWWKMTARRPLSRALGILSLLGLGSSIAMLVLAALGSDTYQDVLERVSPIAGIFSVVFYAALAYLYLNSAARLGAPPPRIREPELTPRPKLN